MDENKEINMDEKIELKSKELLLNLFKLYNNREKEDKKEKIIEVLFNGFENILNRIYKCKDEEQYTKNKLIQERKIIEHALIIFNEEYESFIEQKKEELKYIPIYKGQIHTLPPKNLEKEDR